MHARAFHCIVPLVALLLTLFPALSLAQHSADAGAPDTATSKPIAPRAADDPKKASEPTFASALAEAQSQSKLLVIKFRDKNCELSDEMETTTWKEQKVSEWLAANAIMFEATARRDKRLFEDHLIDISPTVVAYFNGQEMNRCVGYMEAESTLDWLKNVKEGKGPVEIAKARSTTAVGNNHLQRIRDAKLLREANELDAAGAIMYDVWRLMQRDDPLGIERNVYVRPEAEEICRVHEPARALFVTSRDFYEAKLDPTPPKQNVLREWIALNRIVGEPERTLAWFDAVKGSEVGRKAIESGGRELERLIHERVKQTPATLRDLSILSKRPDFETMTILGALIPEFMQKKTPEEQAQVRHDLILRVARLHAALILDGRAPEADRVRNRAIETIDAADMRLALLEIAAEHIPDRKSIRAWSAPMLDQLDATLKANPDAELSARAAAARKALSR